MSSGGPGPCGDSAQPPERGSAGSADGPAQHGPLASGEEPGAGAAAGQGGWTLRQALRAGAPMAHAAALAALPGQPGWRARPGREWLCKGRDMYAVLCMRRSPSLRVGSRAVCMARSVVSQERCMTCSVRCIFTAGVCWRLAARPTPPTEAAESSVTALGTYSYGQFKFDQQYGPMHVPSLPGRPPPRARTLLAVGGVDNSVSLLLAPPGGGFAPAARLAGHTDWVRSLAFRRGAGARCGPRSPLAPAPWPPVPAQRRDTGGC